MLALEIGVADSQFGEIISESITRSRWVTSKSNSAENLGVPSVELWNCGTHENSRWKPGTSPNLVQFIESRRMKNL
jgi:hypothetical protein